MNTDELNARLTKCADFLDGTLATAMNGYTNRQRMQMVSLQLRAIVTALALSPDADPERWVRDLARMPSETAGRN
jgi:hypothetical protein